MGKIFFQNNELVSALDTYKLSIKIAPDGAKILRRELYSNISLIYVKLKKYDDAKKAASDCVTVDHTWFKVSLIEILPAINPDFKMLSDCLFLVIHPSDIHHHCLTDDVLYNTQKM